MTDKDYYLKSVLNMIEHEGLDYTIQYYPHWDYIEDMFLLSQYYQYVSITNILDKYTSKLIEERKQPK